MSPPELLEFIQEHKPGSAIDLGCGTGTNIITLAGAGWQVIGVDFAPRAIKLARKKVSQAGVRAELAIGDATKLQGIKGPFDLALDIGCFHSIPRSEQTKYLEQLDRILAPNGSWLMYGFFKEAVNQMGPGLVEADMQRISSQLTLVSRRDGFNRGETPSAWFLFQKERQVDRYTVSRKPTWGKDER